jgi:signal transduction histidine kinase
MAIVRAAHEHVVQDQHPSALALDRTMRRFALALRCGGVVAACVISGVSGGDGISRGWQLGVFVGLGAWVLVFVVVALREGLITSLIAADVVVIALVVVLQSRLLPAATIAGGSAWVVALASTSVFIAMLTLRPSVGAPLACGVLVAYAVGAPGSFGQLEILGVQVIVAGVMRGFLHRAGAHTQDVVTVAAGEERRARVAAVRRADDREYHRRMHDSVLSTLTAVAIGIDGGSPALHADLARSMEVLSELDEPAKVYDGEWIDLAESLRVAARQAPAVLAVELTVTSILLPLPVAEALIASVGEALRNVARYGHVPRAQVVAQDCGDVICVEVIDHGVGFDPTLVPASKRGIRESIIARMEAVGGNAAVQSHRGRGTCVTLRWPRA